jgi:hypothetical protein
MLLDTQSELDEPVYLKKNSIDRSIGYMVVGAAVMSFFLLSVIGMGRVQSLSDQAIGIKPVAPEAPQSDISDSAEPEATR